MEKREKKTKWNKRWQCSNSLLFAIAALLLTMVLGTAPVHAAAKKTKLNYTTVNLCRYHSCKLKVKNTKKAVKWQSSDIGVASVEADGTLVGNNPGTCTIKAVIGKKKLTCKVTVQEYEEKEIFAAYGWEAALQLLGGSDNVKIESVFKGEFLNNMAFGYVVASYKTKTGEEKKAYLYVYQQELPEEGQAYITTSRFGNLIIRVDSKEMERMVMDRSTALDIARIGTAHTSLATYEKLQLEKSSTFAEKHTWLGM